MEVDMAEALAKQQEQMVQDFRAELRTQKIRYSGVRRVGDQVQVVFRDEADQAKALSFLRRQNADLVFTTDQKGDDFILLASLSEAKVKEVKKYALEQNITIIRNRVNELGVAEPLVQQQGGERIIVELPGIQDTARAKEILGPPRPWSSTWSMRLPISRPLPQAACRRAPRSTTIATVVPWYCKARDPDR